MIPKTLDLSDTGNFHPCKSARVQAIVDCVLAAEKFAGKRMETITLPAGAEADIVRSIPASKLREWCTDPAQDVTATLGYCRGGGDCRHCAWPAAADDRHPRRACPGAGRMNSAAPLPHHVQALEAIKASIEAEKRAEREAIRPPNADDYLIELARKCGAAEAGEYLRLMGRNAFSPAALAELRELTA